ncbi:probable E3 ubiquitin-protein ligase ARI3 [Triticum urartu]|uniref:RBR-type E3 ubiquitin transferase n=1 Tax=Triticum urartu TaxID=4572 RepID=A0A8R7U4X1_TRIUA|nr:probable E3 ubiquitin-protein ligase ARI3 [Triticum urartu]
MASDDDCYYYYDDDGDGEEDEEDGEEAADWDGLAVGADEDDLGLLEDDPPHSERRVDCWAITEDTLSAAQQEDLSTMMNLLNIKQHQARSLFIHHRWKIDCIYDCLDRKGRDRMLREAGIVLQEKSSMLIGASRTPSTSVQCNVCFDDDLSPAAVSTMDCGHCFCNDCWTEHFNAAIDGGKKQIRCMEVKCLAICDEGIVQRLLGQKYPDAAKRFDRFLLESYLEDNDFVKWCPSIPHCGRAIRVGTGDRYCEVKCLCGVSFCFNCMEQTHSPCPCTIWKQWNTRIHGESENIKWIVKNTKSCPKCFKPIEKRDGCNLVKCKCGQYMCWLCGGPTGSAHTWTNIEGHSCNRYKESKDKVDTGRRQLERYAHYCNRFKIHEDSYKEQHEKLGPAIKEKVKQLESNHLRPRLIRDGDWLTDAHQRLLWSRQVVSRSYAFAYHMFGGELRAHRSERGSLAPVQNLFESQQEQLERHVEQLSKVLVTDIPALPDQEIVKVKQEVVNLDKILERLCGEMYTCIQDELLPLLTEPMDIAAYTPDGPVRAKVFRA